MEVKKKDKIDRKFKIILKETNNNNYNESAIIRNNSLDIIYLCYEYYFGKNKRYIKKNIVKCINKIFRTNYNYNKIKRITIKYNNKSIYKSRAYNKINNELEINIKSINFKKFKKIKKTNRFIKLKRKFLNNSNWFNFIENDLYQSGNIFLDPIMDRIEINIINVVDKPSNTGNKYIHYKNKDIKLCLNEDNTLIASQSNLENLHNHEMVVDNTIIN